MPCIGWDQQWEHRAGRREHGFLATRLCLCEGSDGASRKAEAVLKEAGW